MDEEREQPSGLVTIDPIDWPVLERGRLVTYTTVGGEQKRGVIADPSVSGSATTDESPCLRIKFRGRGKDGPFDWQVPYTDIASIEVPLNAIERRIQKALDIAQANFDTLSKTVADIVARVPS